MLLGVFLVIIFKCIKITFYSSRKNDSVHAMTFSWNFQYFSFYGNDYFTAKFAKLF